VCLRIAGIAEIAEYSRIADQAATRPDPTRHFVFRIDSRIPPVHPSVSLCGAWSVGRLVDRSVGRPDKRSDPWKTTTAADIRVSWSGQIRYPNGNPQSRTHIHVARRISCGNVPHCRHRVTFDVHTPAYVRISLKKEHSRDMSDMSLFLPLSQSCVTKYFSGDEPLYL